MCAYSAVLYSASNGHQIPPHKICTFFLHALFSVELIVFCLFIIIHIIVLHVSINFYFLLYNLVDCRFATSCCSCHACYTMLSFSTPDLERELCSSYLPWITTLIMSLGDASEITSLSLNNVRSLLLADRRRINIRVTLLLTPSKTEQPTQLPTT